MFITISDILTLRDTKNNRERSFVSFVIYRGDVEQKKASQLFVTFLGGWNENKKNKEAYGKLSRIGGNIDQK